MAGEGRERWEGKRGKGENEGKREEGREGEEDRGKVVWEKTEEDGDETEVWNKREGRG